MISRTPQQTATALLLLLSGTALAGAADLAPVYKVPSPVPAWSGFYAGLNAGYAFGDAHTALPFNGPAVTSAYDGFIGGGQIGFNWQTGAAVFGLEADIQYADVKGSEILPATTVSAANTLDWFGTARARAGYAFGSVLPYVTGGFAFGRNAYQFTDITTGNGAGGTATHTGWTVGGGVEFAVREAWSVKLEYLHVDLGEQDTIRGVPFANEVTPISLKFDLVRAGVNYRF
jgi:outer membrane immunogenic protein